MVTVPTDWRTARAEAALALAVALEYTLEHIANVEAALSNQIGAKGTAGEKPSQIVTAGHAYAALLRSKVSELRAEADGLTTGLEEYLGGRP